MVPKVEALVVKKKELSDADIDKFGKKDPEAYPWTCQSCFLFLFLLLHISK